MHVKNGPDCTCPNDDFHDRLALAEHDRELGRLKTRQTRVEGDNVDLFIALTEAVRRLEKLGGDYQDLLRVLERTGSDPFS